MHTGMVHTRVNVEDVDVDVVVGSIYRVHKIH